MGDAWERHEGSEQRQDVIGRELFERAVIQAATIATQNVARIHRLRLVTQAGLTAFTATALIGLILALIFRSQAQAIAHKNSVANCELLRGLAEPMADFILTDAKLRSGQANASLVEQLFRAVPPSERSVWRLIAASSARLNQQTVDRWEHVDAPKIKAIVAVNCQARIR